MAAPNNAEIHGLDVRDRLVCNTLRVNKNLTSLNALSTTSVLFEGGVTLTGESTVPYTVTLPVVAPLPDQYLLQTATGCVWETPTAVGSCVTADEVTETPTRLWVTETAQSFEGVKTCTARVNAPVGVATGVVEVGEGGALSIRQNNVEQLSLSSSITTLKPVHLCNDTLDMTSASGALCLTTTAPSFSLSHAGGNGMTVNAVTGHVTFPRGLAKTDGAFDADGNLLWNPTGNTKALLHGPTLYYLAFDGVSNGRMNLNAGVRQYFTAGGVTRALLSSSSLTVQPGIVTKFGAAQPLNFTGLPIQAASGVLTLNSSNTIQFRQNFVDALLITNYVSFPTTVLYTSIQSWTGEITLTPSYSTFMANTSASSCTLTLPTASSMAGIMVTVIRNDATTTYSLTLDAATNNVSLQGALATNITTTTPLQSYQLFSDGAGWFLF